MTEPAAAPAPAPAAAPPPAATWHAGADAELVGFWTNKGYDLSDPLKFATGITEQYRAAEKHLGAPANEMLRIPKANAPEAEVKAFWNRLGAPKEAKEYDFSGVKFNGADLDQGFADTMRATLAAAFVPKDKAAAIVGSVVKWLEGQDTAEAAQAKEAFDAQVAALDKAWGPNKAANMLNADQGAQRLGVSKEEVSAIGKVIGVDRAAELFRKIGAGTTEDTFVQGAQPGSQPTSASAAARIDELNKDQSFVKRYLAGDQAAVREYQALLNQATGWIPEAA